MWFWIVSGCCGSILIAGLLASLLRFLILWNRDLDYLNMEIERCEGREKRHWQREKRRHLRKIFPFMKKAGHSRKSRQRK